MKKKNLTALLLTGVTAVALLAEPAHAANVQPQAEKTYTIQAEHWSRDDFSWQAAPAAFTGVYTRELYNTVRQTILDGTPGDHPAYTMVPQNNYGTVKRLVGRRDAVRTLCASERYQLL